MRKGLLAAALLAATGAVAQESTNRVAADTDWSVFVEQNPRECWSVSAPKSTRLVDSSGNPTSGNRGEILLFVFFRPGQGVEGQVTFTGGYPFAGGSTVTMTIGGETFELFTEGEWAWPATPQDDARLVAAMRRGAEAEVRGRSGRGNVTIDEFSLLGFTAALEEAQNRCAG
ncbi:invasion associated locus B family protein [Histidinibacterium lentulum]|uniref:Invasion associated locus B family protein n=1 Tax=Histidinibacterium lentulum TaxID=2480588 RepID=A0A3N2R5Z7_9RHOB|nr:invasion associated locus B family protein [Histidinibacterium lentulum]ROU02823.1 hypothetical protein EAT49_10660 [Histidinibacterium lentulum]